MLLRRRSRVTAGLTMKGVSSEVFAVGEMVLLYGIPAMSIEIRCMEERLGRHLLAAESQVTYITAEWPNFGV